MYYSILVTFLMKRIIKMCPKVTKRVQNLSISTKKLIVSVIFSCDFTLFIFTLVESRNVPTGILMPHSRVGQLK